MDPYDFEFFRFIWHQTDFRLMLHLSENGNYDQNLVRIKKIECVCKILHLQQSWKTSEQMLWNIVNFDFYFVIDKIDFFSSVNKITRQKFFNTSVLKNFSRVILLSEMKNTEKTKFPIPFTLNEIWSWQHFSIRFWTK